MPLAEWVGNPVALDASSIEAELPDLCAALTPDETTLRIRPESMARLSGASWELTVSGALVRADDEPDSEGDIHRVLVVPLTEGEHPFVRHEILVMPQGLRGRGHGSRCVRRSAELYASCGFREVRLRAAQYGRYVWAMCGFEFADEAEKLAVIEAANRFVTKLPVTGLDAPVDFTGIEHPWQIAMVEGEVRMDDLAAARDERLTDPVSSADESETLPLGKAVLMAGSLPDWDGRLSLDPEGVGLQFLKTYTEKDHG